MKSRRCLLILAWLLFACEVFSRFTSCVVMANTSIVVNFGTFPSAEVAGKAEKQVNWHDADASDDTACTESYAALELQRCLRRMTDRPEDFAIVKDNDGIQGDMILVGGPASNAASRRMAAQLRLNADKLAELGPQGYSIKSGELDGRRIWLIAGCDRVGTLYGAYDFLHRLGCRWFAPEGIHEEIPRIDRIPTVDAAESPSFQVRGFHAWDDRGTPEFLVWMARNRLNFWTVSRGDHALMRKLGILMACGMHDAEEMFIGPSNPYPYHHSRFSGNQDKPADPYPVGKQYRGDANQDGTLSNFEAHPEWYAWDGHKRIPGIHGPFGTNFCTSNADAAAEYVKNYVQSLIDGAYREADVVNFWLCDDGKWCQCQKCLAQGTPTDRILSLVHGFNQEIKKARTAGRIRRPIQVRFLVYSDTLSPPTRSLPDAFDYETCLATFFPIAHCYVHPIDDRGCPRNRQYILKLQSWASEPDRYYRGTIALGEYYNLSLYKCLPVCYMHAMANDIPYYYKAGARHFDYMHVTTAEWGTKSLTNYQMARQLWDVNADCPSLWQDYFARRYGTVAPTMKDFYDSLEKTLCNVQFLKGRDGFTRALSEGREELFPDSHLRYRREPGKACDGTTFMEMIEHGRTCRTLIAKALAQPVPDRIKARLAEDGKTFTYAERTLQYYNECVQAFQLIRAGDREKARQHLKEACRVAELLKADATSTSFSSSHANDKDALAATLAASALDRLKTLLEQ